MRRIALLLPLFIFSICHADKPPKDYIDLPRDPRVPDFNAMNSVESDEEAKPGDIIREQAVQSDAETFPASPVEQLNKELELNYLKARVLEMEERAHQRRMERLEREKAEAAREAENERAERLLLADDEEEQFGVELDEAAADRDFKGHYISTPNEYIRGRHWIQISPFVMGFAIATAIFMAYLGIVLSCGGD